MLSVESPTPEPATTATIATQRVAPWARRPSAHPVMLAAAAATVAAGLAAVAPLPAHVLLPGAAVAIMIVAAADDLRTRRIRNTLVAPALVLALLGAVDMPAAAAGALVAPLPLLVMAVAMPGAMGMGDVKLFAPAGALAGLSAVPQLWVAVAVLGGVLAVTGALRGGRRATIAYGPAIAAGTLLVAFL